MVQLPLGRENQHGTGVGSPSVANAKTVFVEQAVAVWTRMLDHAPRSAVELGRGCVLLKLLSVCKSRIEPPQNRVAELRSRGVMRRSRGTCIVKGP